MSHITSEINKITGTIIGISAKLIIYALAVLLLVEGVSKGYEFGHEVFYATAVDSPPGTDITVRIADDAAVSEIAGDLYKLGLIHNQYAFAIQKLFYDYEINPGIYVLNTSMTSKEILILLNEKPEQEDTDAPQSETVTTVEQLSETDGTDTDNNDDAQAAGLTIEVQP